MILHIVPPTPWGLIKEMWLALRRRFCHHEWHLIAPKPQDALSVRYWECRKCGLYGGTSLSGPEWR